MNQSYTVVRFHRGCGLVSDLIAWWTGGWVTHVDFVVPEGLLGAKGMEGVRIRPPGECPYQDILLPVADGAAFARSCLGSRYDWLGALACAFKLKWQSADAWFCSELVLVSLEAAGFVVCPQRKRLLTPWELYNLLLPLGYPLNRLQLELKTR